MSADPGPFLDRSGRPSAVMVCPLPPMRTGVATYALRVLEYTRDSIDWTVHAPAGADGSCLPGDIRCFRLERDGAAPGTRRIFMLGNSPECFEVSRALLAWGGTAVFHETVMHHMLRFCLLAEGDAAGYRRELLFEYGPSAERIERLLSRRGRAESEFDSLLKAYPLTGRLLHATDALVCLGASSAAVLGARCPGKPVFRVSHPLSPVPALPHIERPDCRFLLGMVGGGHPGRNPGIFLDAVEIVRQTVPGVKAVLVGAGWPDGLPDWAFTTGRLQEPEYQAWIRQLDLVVDTRHPDCGETSGSLLEALRAGIPAITPASGGFLSMPSECVSRIPVPPTPTGVAAAIRHLLSEPELRHSLSKASSSWAEAQGSAERARSEWAGIMALQPVAPRRGDAVVSLSAAWHEPPRGLVRRLGPGPVTWHFEGGASFDPPSAGMDALVTALGTGQVSGMPLNPTATVFEVPGGRVEITGTGELTQIAWVRKAGLP